MKVILEFYNLTNKTVVYLQLTMLWAWQITSVDNVLSPEISFSSVSSSLSPVVVCHLVNITWSNQRPAVIGYICTRRRSFVNRYGFKVYPINYFTRILVKNLIGQKKLYRKLQVSGWNSDLDRSEACWSSLSKHKLPNSCIPSVPVVNDHCRKRPRYEYSWSALLYPYAVYRPLPHVNNMADIEVVESRNSLQFEPNLWLSAKIYRYIF